MYNKIGGKIKAVAKLEYWLGVICSIIIGGILLSLYIATEEESLLFTGILLIIVGSIIAWLGSLLIYGFGQLVENSDILAGRMENSDISVGEANNKIISILEQEDMSTELEQEEIDNKINSILEQEDISIEDKIFELDELLNKGHIAYDEYEQIVKKIARIH